MNETDMLVNDALELRKTSTYKSFATNTAAIELRKKNDIQSFLDIKKILENENLESLLGKPGLNGVLGSMFIIGNRCCPGSLRDILHSWPAELVGSILAQAPLALQGEAIAPELLETIECLKEHENDKVRKWASRFKMKPQANQ